MHWDNTKMKQGGTLIPTSQSKLEDQMEHGNSELV